MSERAREFLDHWLADHVASVDDTRRLRETVRLVTLCREVAVRAGLAPEELRKASGGDLRPCARPRRLRQSLHWPAREPRRRRPWLQRRPPKRLRA